MKKSSFLFFSAIIALVFTTCKKEEEKLQEQLPPITIEGKMTFGCIIRANESIVIKVTGKYLPPTGLFDNCTAGSEIKNGYLVRGERTIYIEADNCDGGDPVEISLIFPFDVKAGDEVKIDTDNINRASLDFIGLYPKHYVADSTAGVGTIKFLRADSIFSGTFSFFGYDKMNDYYLNISDGRFDLKLE
jgi:hypothetical protein